MNKRATAIGDVILVVLLFAAMVGLFVIIQQHTLTETFDEASELGAYHADYIATQAYLKMIMHEQMATLDARLGSLPYTTSCDGPSKRKGIVAYSLDGQETSCYDEVFSQIKEQLSPDPWLSQSRRFDAYTGSFIIEFRSSAEGLMLDLYGARPLTQKNDHLQRSTMLTASYVVSDTLASYLVRVSHLSGLFDEQRLCLLRLTSLDKAQSCIKKNMTLDVDVRDGHLHMIIRDNVTGLGYVGSFPYEAGS
jgi:hypothetical protein